MNRDEALTPWLLGEDDPVRLGELQRWLQADPQHRQQARDELALHLALRAHLQPTDMAAVAQMLSEVRSGLHSAHTTQRRRVTHRCIDEVRRRQLQIRTALVLAAALLIACTLALAVLASAGTPQPVAPTIAAVGHITDLSGPSEIERASLRRPLVKGEALRAGDQLIAGPGSRIAWRDDHIELELREGRGQVRPQPDTVVTLTEGVLRLAVPPKLPGAPLVRLIAATAAIETSDTVLQVAVSEAMARLTVERGSAVFTQGSSVQTVTPARSAFSDARGTYQILFEFDQSSAEPDPRVAYGEAVADPACRDGWALRGVILDGSREVYLHDAAKGPLVLEAGVELRFSYRVEGSGPLRVFAHNLDLQADITAELGLVEGPGWHVATIRLADFHRQGEMFQQIGAAPGERLNNLIIASDRPETLTALSIDEVRWVLPSPR